MREIGRRVRENLSKIKGWEMKIYDITVPIREGMHDYPGNQPFERKRMMDMEKGDIANLTAFTMSAHTGTHMDAPLHFVRDGAMIEEIDLGVMIGPATVYRLDSVEKIERAELEPLDLQGVERVLFKTVNSGLWQEKGFQPRYVYISGEAAQYLVEAGVKLVGIDYLSVQQYDSADLSPHLTLLGSGVALLEGIDLSGVQPGRYQLVALPLKLMGVEGAPARAVLIEE